LSLPPLLALAALLPGCTDRSYRFDFHEDG